jgi:hypothetical protein
MAQESVGCRSMAVVWLTKSAKWQKGTCYGGVGVRFAASDGDCIEMG